ncbi:MAG: hypothetical protein AAGK78_09475, partial [Planctomycetota bacterium]
MAVANPPKQQHRSAASHAASSAASHAVGHAATTTGDGKMQLRKFLAPTMAECLQAVRTELGPKAVVLGTRQIT